MDRLTDRQTRRPMSRQSLLQRCTILLNKLNIAIVGYFDKCVTYRQTYGWTDIASYLIAYKDASKTIISTRQSFLFGFQQIMVQEADVSIVSSKRLGQARLRGKKSSGTMQDPFQGLPQFFSWTENPLKPIQPSRV